MVRLLFIGKSQNSHSLENVRKLPTKCVANTKAEAAQAPSGFYLRTFHAKLRNQNIKILLFVDQHAVQSQNTSYKMNAYYMFFPQNCTSIVQTLDQGVIWPFKYYYHKKLVRKSVSINDHKLLHYATIMKVNILDALQFTAETWCHFLCIIIVHHFH